VGSCLSRKERQSWYPPNPVPVYAPTRRAGERRTTGLEWAALEASKPIFVKFLNVGVCHQLMRWHLLQHIDLHTFARRSALLHSRPTFHAGLVYREAVENVAPAILHSIYSYSQSSCCGTAVNEERNELVSDPALTFRHDYPPTKLMFIPDKEWQHPDLLVSCGCWIQHQMGTPQDIGQVIIHGQGESSTAHLQVAGSATHLHNTALSSRDVT
jgi:hypothetical protein